MAESSFPFGSSSIPNEDAWSSMFRMVQLDGVLALSESGTDLKVTGSNASTVAVAAGEAWVQGTYYKNDASLNVNVPTNSGGASARKDLIVLRRDPSADSTSIKYKTGGTSFPSLTQTTNSTWEIPLAQVTVAAGASVVTTTGVVDQRWFLGRPVAFGSSGARRPPVRGQFLFESGNVYVGDGTAWKFLATAEDPQPRTYPPSWDDADGNAINWGSGSQNIGKYKLLGGGLCWVKIQLGPTGNPPASGPIRVSLPFPVRGDAREHFIWNYTSGNGEGSALGVGMVFPTENPSKISRLRYLMSNAVNSTTAPNSFSLTTNTPFNIRSGDYLTITGTYEIAL
ncbi:hypothetical protein AB0L66_11440 [Streptomyces sp. NPDC052207]|uniref:hypothetical protein n=1 Tax=Streptomyces sp. NPDC052207 TaxID=3155418 RepID=UPI00342351CB